MEHYASPASMSSFVRASTLWRESIVPIFDRIVFTRHAERRMRERHIREEDVAFVLRNADGRPGEGEDWIFEVGKYRIVIVEEGSTARVLTVIRRKGQR